MLCFRLTCPPSRSPLLAELLQPLRRDEDKDGALALQGLHRHDLPSMADGMREEGVLRVCTLGLRYPMLGRGGGGGEKNDAINCSCTILSHLTLPQLSGSGCNSIHTYGCMVLYTANELPGLIQQRPCKDLQSHVDCSTPTMHCIY